MLPWLPVLLLFLRDPLIMVHASITYPINVDSDCHGDGKQTSISDGPKLSIESGDIFERLRETNNFDCRWNIRASNRTNGIIAVVEKLKLRKNTDGSCIDYLQFSLKKYGAWIDGRTFCKLTYSIEDEAGHPMPTSIKPILRNFDPDLEGVLPEEEQSSRIIKFINSDGAVIDPKGNIRISLHVGTPAPNYRDNLEFVISINTYEDDGKISGMIDWEKYYRPLENHDDQLSTKGNNVIMILIVFVVLKVVLLWAYITYRCRMRKKTVLVFRRLDESTAPSPPENAYSTIYHQHLMTSAPGGGQEFFQSGGNLKVTVQ